MKFNINNYVRVKLTPLGREIYRERRRDFKRLLEKQCVKVKLADSMLVEDEEGWSKWQLWNLMEVFGPHVGLGSDPVFQTEIDILFPS